MTETPKSRAMSLRVTAIDKFTMFDVAGDGRVTPFFAFSRFVQLLCFQSSMDVDNCRWVSFNQGVVNVHEPPLCHVTPPCSILPTLLAFPPAQFTARCTTTPASAP